MALQKQSLSIDFIKGTDTKTNDIITENFKDMENVVFTGDMTAKKMGGYDLLATLPEHVDESSLFKRGEDIIAQTSTATYKYFPNITAFKKISDIGSCSLKNEKAHGNFFASGTNYNAFNRTTIVSNYNAFNLTTIVSNSNANTNFIQNIFTFTDKLGNVLNTVTINSGTPLPAAGYQDKWTKGVCIGDDFYFTHINHDVDGSTDYAQYLQVSRFVYDSPSNSYKLDNQSLFSLSGLKTYTYSSFLSGGTTSYKILAMDIIPIGTDIYIAVKSDYAQEFIKFSQDLNSFSIRTIAETIDLGFQLHNYAGNLLMSVGIATGGGSPGNYLYLRKYASNMTYISETVVASVLGANYNIAASLWSFFPTSTTVGVGLLTIIAETLGSATTPSAAGYGTFGTAITITSKREIAGLMPIGKIFTYNGKYYCEMMLCMGEVRTFLLMDAINMVPVAIFNRSIIPGANPFVFDPSKRVFSGFPYFIAGTFNGCYAIQEQYGSSGVYQLPSFSEALNLESEPSLATLTFGTYENQALEVTKKLTISGGLPCYYDGATFTEHDLIGEPYLIYNGYNTPTNTTSWSPNPDDPEGDWIRVTLPSGTGGTLPASDYRVVAHYEWKDSSGTVFRSGLSNIIGDVMKTSKLTLPVNSSINILIGFPIVTTRTGIVCKIFLINNSMSSYQLVATIPVGQKLASSTNVEIKNLPSATDEDLYTSLTGAGATQAEDLPAMSIKAMALYSDRMFYIKNGDNNAIYFSLKKEATVDFSFNEETFYLNVFDKRGFNEDELTGLYAMDGRLFIFKQNSILYTAGDGPGNDGSSSDLLSPQLVTTDVGCISNRSIVLTPHGLMFMSDKGIYLLDRKLQVSYVGASVERFNSEKITSALLLESKNEIRFTTLSGYVLVFNYFSNAWSWFKNLPSVSAVTYGGKYAILDASGRLLTESSTHNKLVTSAITQKISSPWIRGNGKQWWQKVYDLTIVGKYKSPHQIKVSFYFDYEQYADAVYTLDPLTSANYNLVSRPSNADIESGVKVDGVYQIQIDIPRKSCQAFRFEIEDIPLDIANNTGECFALSSFTIVFGVKNGPAKIPNSKTY